MSLLKAFRFRLTPTIPRGLGDAVAVVALLALTVVGAWGSLRGDPVVGMDAATQYYPWYSYLGESLRSGDVPGWNPHQFSGAPFAADPLSGWTYLPAMLLFASLPLVAAVKGYLLFHLLLAGLAAYALARALGIPVPGAFLSAIAFEFSGFIYLQNTCCFPYVAVAAWLPLALLGVETATRRSSWAGRLPWWSVSGLALSQILAAWLGQGSYYALLAIGGYVAYRTLFDPPATGEARGSLWTRLLWCGLHGGAVLAFGFGLAAAGVLPRLEYNGLSNLAGGYPGEEGGAQTELVGGLSIEDWVLLLEPGHWYAGVAVLALALVAPLVVRRRFAVPRYSGGARSRVLPALAGIARGRFAVPYFTALSLGALVLARNDVTTPLHSTLYLALPRFDQLHPHSPERVMVVFYLGTALLAGAGLTGLAERAGKKPLLLVPPFLAAISLAVTPALVHGIGPEASGGGWDALYSSLSGDGMPVPVGPALAAMLAVVLVAAYALIPAWLPAWRSLAFALLILVVFADLLAANRAIMAEERYATEGGVELDLATYYRPSDPGRFLRSREEPFRYFGYEPRYGNYGTVSSPTRYTNPLVRALEVENRAMSLGLQSIQGYNPVRVARYDEYMWALNGVGQSSHHFADVFDEDLDSPLLDLLNTRYITVPADKPPENQPGFERELRAEHPVVYEDDRFAVLENKDALPRAWVVHQARQVRSGQEALDLLSVGQVDPVETALLEEEPPPISEPEDPSADRASVMEYEADRVELETSTGAPGLLVLSEVYYPAWRAYVDGEPAEVYAADHLFRAVAVPAGEHVVELRYESGTLRVGIAVSLVTLTVLVALLIVAGVRRWRGTAKASHFSREGT